MRVCDYKISTHFLTENTHMSKLDSLTIYSKM
jgi:hypothetical protein